MRCRPALGECGRPSIQHTTAATSRHTSGVTAFGIFLTPVFYVVVDRLTEGHWGRSAKLRRVGTVLRWALAFGWVRPLIRAVAARRR